MELSKAIETAIDGNAVLFVGSGFSLGGKTKTGEGMVVGKGLSHKICRRFSIEMTDNLSIAADRCLSNRGKEVPLKVFIAYLNSILVCDETSNEQDTILSLPWLRIYSTNYDNVIEESSKKQGIKRETITATTERFVAKRSVKEAIIHINGYIGKVDERNFFEDFRIADGQYMQDGFLESDWKQFFVNDLKMAKAIIFIGYSLEYDQQLVREIGRLNIQNKCTFVDIETINRDSLYRMERFGQVDLIGTDGLAKEIEKIKGKYVASPVRQELRGFERCSNEDYFATFDPGSETVRKLYVQGDFLKGLYNKVYYCIHRNDAINEVKRLLKERKYIVVQSSLGNGKTMFLNSLGYELAQNYDVYWVDSLDTMYDDIQIVLEQMRNPIVLLVDDYGRNMRLIEELSKEKGTNIRLVMTSRSSINLNLYYDLQEKYGIKESELELVDIDILNDDEINQLLEILEYYHFWGKNADKSVSQKKRILKRTYKSMTSQIFYMLLKSEVIEKSINEIFKELSGRRDLQDFIGIQAINMVCELHLKYADIRNFSRITDNLLKSYMCNFEIRELLKEEEGRFVLSSAIFSKYIIESLFSADDLLRLLIDIYIKCDNAIEEEMYEQHRRMLISRSNLQLLFKNNRNGMKYERCIFDFYDSIKNTRTARTNPFFWFQFAISALNLKKFDLSGIYFENAYAYAEKEHMVDTHQLDTHKARYLLEKEMHTNKNISESAFNTFKDAHDLLFNVKQSGQKVNYVLGQMTVYNDYFRFYQAIFDERQLNEMYSMAIEMRQRFLNYFRLSELRVIPNDMINAYEKYRSIFLGSGYLLMLSECDDAFNTKVDSRRKIGTRSEKR